MVSSAKKKRRPRDRLSDLPDDILGHVLSFLPAEEAGRAAVLSRRWRRAFDVVQTISFQPLHILSGVEAENRRPIDRVNNALLARRSSGGDAPLRCLRVPIRWYTAPDCYAVDKWLSYALRHGIQELRLETSMQVRSFPDAVEQCCLRGGSKDVGFQHGTNDDYDSDVDSRYNDDDDSDSDDDYDSDYDSAGATPTYDGNTGVPLYAHLPRHRYDVSPELFSCATMRALHLVSCSLPPRLLAPTIRLPSLETLSLANITYTTLQAYDVPRQISAENIQRVISCCPRLADLTLEGCHQITDITVQRLARFALRCCHGVQRVAVDASSERLWAFEYRGRPPAASCFRLGGGAPRVSSVEINICGSKRSRTMDQDRLWEFLVLFAEAAHLQLNVIWNARFDHDGFHALHFPPFHNLTRLELGCRCTDPGAVRRVAGVLRQTPNLTALTIKLCWDKSREVNCRRVLDMPNLSVSCLRERVREMSVEQYHGLKPQKMLLKWLLCAALVVESGHEQRDRPGAADGGGRGAVELGEAEEGAGGVLPCGGEAAALRARTRGRTSRRRLRPPQVPCSANFIDGEPFEIPNQT
ncbi:hypothetical protein QYE76_038463 [Lolium multiflorum]|uniref:F-box domain-containing protein n=1 Tax=Lolium multiflorum TaxID=4521 RepID=A0AAD8T7M5_LOLMU|nr:hypothetical protein QYE76_038463 [Lolium multiflorum]